MSLNTAIEAETGAYAEILAAVRTRTVTTLGDLAPGTAQMLLVSALILPTIAKVAKLDDHVNPLYHGACQALMSRINGNVIVDMTMAGIETMFDLILADAEIAGLLAASAFVNASTFKATVMQAATTAVPEFPAVTLHDVIAVKNPALALQEASLPVTIRGISQVLKITTATAMPETVKLTAQISHDGIVWQPVSASGLEQVSGAGLYVFRVLPGPVFITESQVRVVSPYSVGLALV